MIACGKVIFAPIVVIAHNCLDDGFIIAEHFVDYIFIYFERKIRACVADIAREQNHINAVIFQFFKRGSEMADI